MTYIVVSVLKRGTFAETFSNYIKAKAEYAREKKRHDAVFVYIAKVVEGYKRV